MNKKAFTLVELLVVVSIIALLVILFLVSRSKDADVPAEGPWRFE